MYKLGNKYLNLWDEPFMQKEEMTMSLKVLYLYLVSNALSNIAGVYKITDRRIQFDLCQPNLNLKECFLSLRKLKKVYRCGDYVIIKDAPLYIKKMTKTIIKEMDAIIFQTPNKIKMKMKKIHYKYEPLYEALDDKSTQKEKGQKLLIEEKEAITPIKKDTITEGGQDENCREGEEAHFTMEGGLFIVENKTEQNQNGEDYEESKKEQQDEKAKSKQAASGGCSSVWNEGVKNNEEAENVFNNDSQTELPDTEPYWIPQENESEGGNNFKKEENEGEDENPELDIPDEVILKKIRESDSFFEECAREGRQFARNMNRLEIIEKMKVFKRANEISPPIKKESLKAESAKEKTPIEEKTIIESVAEGKNTQTSELPFVFGSAYNEEPYDESQMQAMKANLLLNAQAQNAKTTCKDIELFQKHYAKSVYKQFQEAGLYKGIDYLYFYKCDFLRGLRTLKGRAITVEDQKEAFALNEVIEAYLEKAQKEEDESKKCVMAFYKMCEEREYNSLCVVNY